MDLGEKFSFLSRGHDKHKRAKRKDKLTNGIQVIKGLPDQPDTAPREVDLAYDLK